MRHAIAFALAFVLFAPVAARAQTPTPEPPPVIPRNPVKLPSLDDDPRFKALPPDEQGWVRNMMQRLQKAIADKDMPAIDQLKREAEQHQQALAAAAASGASKPPAPAVVPITPLPPCPFEPPKKPGVLDKLKAHAKRTLQKQAAKADAQVARQTGGNVDAGAQDATATALSQANQPKGCAPVPISIPRP